MKITQTKFLFILFSFVILYIICEDIPEGGYNEFDLKLGVTELVYHIPEISIEGKSPFISFMFTEDNISYIIKEYYEMEKEEDKEIEPFISQKAKWLTFPLILYQNKTKYPFDTITIILNNTNPNPAKLIFINNRKDININLEQFLNLKYYLYSNVPLTPLIFSIDEVNNDTIFFREENNVDTIYDDDNLMYYCIKNGSYEKFTKLNVRKGLSYKIKLNCFISKDENDDFYYYFYISFKTENTGNKLDINEIDFGITNFYMDEKSKEKYFIVQTKELLNPIIVVEYCQNSSFDYQFITQSQKDTIDEEINNITLLNSNSPLTFFQKEEKVDYLIIKINYKESYNNGTIIIFNNYHFIQEPKTYNFQKGNHTLINIQFPKEKYNKYYLKSSSKNMVKLEVRNESIVIFKDFTEYLSFEGEEIDAYIYVDSSKNSTTIEYSYYNEDEKEEEKGESEEEGEYESVISEISQDILDVNLNYSKNDFFFTKDYSHSSDFGFNFDYYYDFYEKYYYYYKRIYGGINFYINNTNIESLVKNKDLDILIQNYGTNNYKLINNEFVILSGSQLITYYNSYGSLYEMYYQKFNDSKIIQMDEYLNKFNNLAKLFIEGKEYTLNFTVDHYIKLDNKFLEAEVIFKDENEKTYKLNKDNRVIKNLSGDNIRVVSNKNAFIYFYKKIKEPNKIKVIEFEEKEIGQNMKFNISFPYNSTNDYEFIYIVKDFGFKECYPFIGIDTMEDISLSETITFYIENIYDKNLENELYKEEGEKYLIYLFNDEDEEGFPILNFENYIMTEPKYYPNLLTKGNNYNFEVIPGNTNGSIILSGINKEKITYQIYTCENDKVQLKIRDSTGSFNYEQYYNYYDSSPTTIDLKKSFSILEHSFKSDREFLFAYSFVNSRTQSSCQNQFSRKIDTFRQISKNFILVKFSQKYTNCLNQYHIIIAKNDEINNVETFSNPCYVTKLMTQNSDSILVKTVFIESEETIVNSIINIETLYLMQNDEIVITVVSYNAICNNDLDFYEPNNFELTKFNDEFIEFNIEEKVKFDFRKRNQFKLNYKQEGDSPLSFNFIFNSKEEFNVIFNDDENNFKEYSIDYNTNSFNITLTKSGTYYFILNPNHYYYYDDNKYFITYVPNKVIDAINLEDKVYINNEQIFCREKLEPRLIKVQNLKEDKYAFLSYQIKNNEDNYKDFDDEYDEDYNEENKYENPFEICKDINDQEVECSKEINIFKFEKNYNYTIKIHFSKEKENYDFNGYYNPSFEISTFTKDLLQKNVAGLHSFEDIQLYIVNLEGNKNLYLSNINIKSVYVSYSDKDINNTNLESLSFQEINPKIGKISGYNYGLIVIIPENNNIKAKSIIANNLFKKYNEKFNIPANETALIYLREEKDDDKKDKILNSLRRINELASTNDDEEDQEKEDHNEGEDYDDDVIYNTLTIFQSPEKNMELFTLNSSREKSNLMVQNTYPMLIYVNEVDKDIEIEIKTYEQKYAFFLAINNNDLLKAYLDLIQRSSEEEKEDEDDFTFKDFFPFNLRINSDLNEFYDFINLYFSDIQEKIIIYIKKFYGGSDFYECNLDLKDVNDYSLITKPLPYCQNKKSIFNRVMKLEDLKLLSGYIGPNSYFDIYLDIEQFSDNKIINPTFNKIEGIQKFHYNNAARYLEKNIEYTLNLTGKHMIKLEPGFDAEIEIYNENNEVFLKLNSSKLTGEFEGEKLKIKSNNNAMVYFYGTMYETVKQIEIDPKQKGKNYKLTISKEGRYIFDFGFKGYMFSDLFSMDFQKFKDYYDEDSEGDKAIVYIENIYDKLTEKLVEGEKLYLYYFDYEDFDFDNKDDYDDKDDKESHSEIEAYVEYETYNLNPPYNEFTFNYIPENESKKNLIINSFNINKIQYQINYCNTPKTIKMFYQSMHDSIEAIIEFKDSKTKFNETLKEGTTKLRFESEDDFVFSYSFIDNYDEQDDIIKEWEKERKEIIDLIIYNITKKENTNLYTIKFKSNYRNSSTRYIIVIAPKNEKYTNETLSNPCLITKLVIEKSEEVKIINNADIGENDFINIDVDLYSVPESKGEYVIGIISQELRFGKKINFYEAIEYINEELKPTKVNIEEREEFDLSKNETYFSIPTDKKSEYNEMLLLHYKLEKSGSFIIEIYGPKGNKESFEINDDEGFINFLYNKNGTYKILFKNAESQLRSTTENAIKGTFEVFTTETPFNLDLKNDNIEFKEFNITDANEPSLKFNIKDLDKDYTKKISISNYDFSNINDIVLINENNLGDKELNFTYYTFEKNSNYNITIKFKSKEGNNYILEKVNILDYSSIEYNNLSSGNFTYNDTDDKFFVIDWKDFDKVLITRISQNPILLLTEISKDQSENLIKEFKNLKFTELKNLTLTKPEKSNHSLLMIEPEIGTKLNFEFIKINEDEPYGKEEEHQSEDISDKSEEDDDDDNNVTIILIIVLSSIIFIALLFFILCYIRKRKQDIDFKKRTEDIQQETLLKDL